MKRKSNRINNMDGIGSSIVERKPIKATAYVKANSIVVVFINTPTSQFWWVAVVNLYLIMCFCKKYVSRKFNYVFCQVFSEGAPSLQSLTQIGFPEFTSFFEDARRISVLEFQWYCQTQQMAHWLMQNGHLLVDHFVTQRNLTLQVLAITRCQFRFCVAQ